MSFVVIDHDNDNEREAESRSKAEEMAQTARDMGSDNVEIALSDTETDGGSEATQAEVVQETEQVPEPPENKSVATKPQSNTLDQLGESLGTDPLDILPKYMITEVDGKPSLNKRGVSVLAHHFGISVTDKETIVYPHETDYTSSVVEFVVEDEDGRKFTGSGEAHVDETPKHQLLRMAETRAYKRAVIFATGTGIVGFQEIMEELQ